MNFKKIILTAFFLTLGMYPSPGHALSCSKKYVSLEENFHKADLVFLATSADDDERVQIKELYKAPVADFHVGQVVDIYAYQSSVPEHAVPAEFLVFAEYRKTRNGYRIVLNPCGASKIATDEYVRQLEAWSHTPGAIEQNTASGDTLIFIGKVSDARQKYNGYEIDFDRIKLFKKPDQIQSKDLTEITVRTGECGAGYETGKKYLIFAGKDKFHAPQPNGHSVVQTGWSTTCFSYNPLYLQEKDFLRKLSRMDQ